jgi:hypothetical protein
MRVQRNSSCNSDIGAIVLQLRRNACPKDDRIRVRVALDDFVSSGRMSLVDYTHRCNAMGEVEHAGIDCDVVITLLHMSPHDLWHIEAHRRMLEGGTLEVDIVIVGSSGSRS